MRFKTKQFIRWDDMDAFGHVNNAKYLVFVQEARIDMFWKSRVESGLKPVFDDMVVARAEVDYKMPITQTNQDFDIEIWVSKIGGAAFDLEYKISSTDGEHAHIKTVQVAVDLETKKSRRLTEEEREILNGYLEA
jgi:acyl-CoA thioester hydrolase